MGTAPITGQELTREAIKRRQNATSDTGDLLRQLPGVSANSGGGFSSMPTLRGLSQQEVADKLGISQSAVSQLEAIDSRPQKRTREKLAAIYGCTQEQISLYLPKEG